MAVLNNTMLQGTAADSGDEGYKIERSVRLNNNNGYLSKIEEAGNRRTWTWSGWVKRNRELQERFFLATDGSGHPSTQLMFDTTGELWAYSFNGSAFTFKLITNAIYEDFSAWYHIVVAVDTTRIATSDRVKIYVNGKQITSFDTADYPSHNNETYINNLGKKIQLSDVSSFPNPYQGYLADVRFVDGLALTPASFGKFTSSGVWDPIDPYNDDGKFALLTVNDGTTWSSNFTGDAIESGFPATYAFDGTEGDGTYRTRSNGNNATFHWGGSSDLGIEYKHGIRVKHWHNGTISVNDVEKVTTTSGSDPEWITVIDGESGTLNKLTITSTGGQKICLYAIEIDGIILQDGLQDLAVKENPNRGVNWVTAGTNAASGGKIPNSPGPAMIVDVLGHDDGDDPDLAYYNPTWGNFETVFNGAIDNTTATRILAAGGQYAGSSASLGGDWVRMRLRVDHIPEGIKRLRVWTRGTGAQTPYQVKLLGSDKSQLSGTATTTLPSSGPTFMYWKNIPLGSATATDIKYIEFSYGGAGSNWVSEAPRFYWGGLEINGHVLVDNTIDNSFHLKFSDVDANKNLGYSQELSKATTGAQPMYGPGAEDSAKSSLVLALPGFDLNDHSATIKGSGSNKTVTATGAVLDSTGHSKFYGSCLKFADDGSNDVISIANNEDLCDFGTGNFTMEAWLKPTKSSDSMFVMGCSKNGSNPNRRGPMIFISAAADNEIRFEYSTGGTHTAYINDGEGGATEDKWTHVAVVRNGNDCKLYINGQQDGSTLDVSSIATAADNNDDPFTIGNNSDSTWGAYDGYMQDVRVYKGAAKYTANFTPPTRRDFTVNNITAETGTITPSDAATGGLPILKVTTSAGTAYSSPISAATDGISNKQLYLPFQGSNGGSTFTDYSGNNRTPDDVTGTPSTSTGSSKFGGVSGYFDGTTDYLKWDQAAWQISANTTDWTVEFWFRWDSGSSGARGICGMLGNGGNNQSWFVALDSNHKIKTEFYLGGTWRNITCDNAISADTWTHVSCVVHGGTYTMYINGTAQSTTVSGISGTTSLPTNAEPFYIGTLGHNSYSEFKGYIQDFRLVDDGLHTGNFTVPGTVPYFTPDNELDSLTDTPTNYGSDSGLGGQVRGNFCTWNYLTRQEVNPGEAYGLKLEEGNLYAYGDNSNWRTVKGTHFVNSGKWYFEAQVITTASGNANGNAYQGLGVVPSDYIITVNNPNLQTVGAWYGDNGWTRFWNSTWTEEDGKWIAGDVIGVAIDCTARSVTFYRNNSQQATASSLWSEGDFVGPGLLTYDDAYGAVVLNTGQRPFKYTAPAGHKCLCTQNIANFSSGDALNDPSYYFDSRVYKGNGGTQTLKFNFRPDFAWISSRNATGGNNLIDAIRGNYYLMSHSSNAQAEFTGGNGVTWDADANKSITLKDTSDGDWGLNGEPGGSYAASSGEYASMFWDAGGAAATASTDGSITPSAHWVNATAGFSVLTYTGGSGTATIGHGLGAVPEFIIVKTHTISGDSRVYHKAMGNTHFLALNKTDAQTDSDTTWNDTSPTNTVFSVGQSGNTYESGRSFTAYIWTPIPGFSAFGSYAGTGSSTGIFNYCGFKPSFIITKVYNGGTNRWNIHDIARNDRNPATKIMWFDSQDAQASESNNAIDILSNGFKLRGDGAATNASGDDYIWAAFAEHPFKFSRAR